MSVRAPTARHQRREKLEFIGTYSVTTAFVGRWPHRIQECPVDGSADHGDCRSDLHHLAHVWLLACLRAGLRRRKQPVHRRRQQVLVPRRRNRCLSCLSLLPLSVASLCCLSLLPLSVASLCCLPACLPAQLLARLPSCIVAQTSCTSML